MSQQKSKETLINWDLVSVNPNDKNWNWKDIFCFWGVNIQSVIGFSLITSLYLIYNLNTFVVLFGTIVGSLFVFILSNLIGKPSQKFGLPFIVLLRSSLGVNGAKYFGLIRCVVGIFLFGIQTYFLSKAFGYLLRIIIFLIDPTLLNKEIFLVFFLGMNAIDWSAIVIAIFFQVFLFNNGMKFNKKIINFSAIAVYISMMMFFFSVFLSDVKFTSQAFLNILDLGNFINKNNLGPIITVAGTTFAYFSIIIISFGDFSRYVKDENFSEKTELQNFIKNKINQGYHLFSTNLTSETEFAPTEVAPKEPTYEPDKKMVDARVIMRDNFDALLNKYPEILIFGEDAGFIGDVNQGLEGLQEKYGETRISDTGIREATILGQGIGMAMRGLRPIAEIQYLDYLLYALQIMSDDLATLRYRSAGKQKAPLIVRTRGHRLEGIWHSGSPMGGIINNLRGMHVLVPRNMTKAAGFYNTLLEGDDPALVIECLNGYRLKEELPTNLGEFKTAIGEIEVVKEGTDITVVSYGSTLRIVEEAAIELLQVGINIEVVDAQSLLPFDLNHSTVKSLAKTNRLLIVDEDVPGGASAYLMQEILENQNGYQYLDSKPYTLTAKSHRPAYGTDGDYFSKPSAEDIFEAAYQIMHEANPHTYKSLY